MVDTSHNPAKVDIVAEDGRLEEQVRRYVAASPTMRAADRFGSIEKTEAVTVDVTRAEAPYEFQFFVDEGSPEGLEVLARRVNKATTINQSGRLVVAYTLDIR